MDYLDQNNRLVAAPEPRWMTSPKRVRVFFGGAPIVDSASANLFRGGGPPVYYFPKADVVQDALVATGRTETNARGTMSLYDVRVGERAAEGAAWGVHRARGRRVVPGRDARVPVERDGRLVRGRGGGVRPREGPVQAHRGVQVDASRRGVRGRREGRGQLLAGGADRAGSPRSATTCRRWTCGWTCCVPASTESRCPYKGKANYYSVETASGLLEDAAWCYKYPTTETAGIAGLVCFFNERVDAIRVDGQELEKPVTNWRR